MTRLVLMPGASDPGDRIGPRLPERGPDQQTLTQQCVRRALHPYCAWWQWTGLHLNTPSRRKQATNNWRGTAKPPVGLASRGSVDESKYFMLSGALVYVRVLAMRKLLMALEDFGRGIDNQRMVAWWA